MVFSGQSNLELSSQGLALLVLLLVLLVRCPPGFRCSGLGMHLGLTHGLFEHALKTGDGYCNGCRGFMASAAPGCRKQPIWIAVAFPFHAQDLQCSWR